MDSEAAHLTEMSIQELTDILDGTIKCDNVNKAIVFLGMLTAYSEADQLNICLIGQTSSGKSYLPKEITKFFPDEDVTDLAGISPTAFRYNGAEYDEDSGCYTVDYERKIMLFSEMPNAQLLANMRPILAHDSKCTEFVVTDMNSGVKDGKKARRTIIRGFPAVVFCSTNSRLNAQEVTRCLLLSPEVSREKLEAGVELTNRREANPEAYQKEIESDPRRELLRQRVRYIKGLEIGSVIVPNPVEVLRRFRRISSNPMPRHQRDIAHLQSLIKAVAMLNAHQRLDDNHNVIATENDIDVAIGLWEQISVSQMLGIPPAIHDFYESYILPPFLAKPKQQESMDLDDNGVTRKEIALYYYSLHNVMPNDEELKRNIIPTLEANSIISITKSQRDGRMQLIIPLVGLDDRQAEPTGDSVVGTEYESERPILEDIPFADRADAENDNE